MLKRDIRICFGCDRNDLSVLMKRPMRLRRLSPGSALLIVVSDDKLHYGTLPLDCGMSTGEARCEGMAPYANRSGKKDS
jgi:hypothetical protein